MVTIREALGKVQLQKDVLESDKQEAGENRQLSWEDSRGREIEFSQYLEAKLAWDSFIVLLGHLGMGFHYREVSNVYIMLEILRCLSEFHIIRLQARLASNTEC
jgi:hypothetical protein